MRRGRASRRRCRFGAPWLGAQLPARRTVKCHAPLPAPANAPAPRCPLSPPAPQAQLALVSEALHAATQRLCRSLRDNLNVPDNMAKARAAAPYYF